MERIPAPERTTKDTVLVVLSFVGLVSSAVVRLVDGPDAVATLLVLCAVVASLWASWRWYDRQPDGRRGE